METLLQITSLVKRAFWLIKLRWFAIAGLFFATYVAGTFLDVALPAKRLYILVGILLVYNFILFDFVRYLTWGKRQVSHRTVSNLIIFQVLADLVILTVILHFSGGIENPFFLYFVFHMILASVLLTTVQSYIIATVAVVLFGALVYTECVGLLTHYTLGGFVGETNYQNRIFVCGTLFILATTLYLVVFMTTSISKQLRRRQDDYEKANALLQEKDNLKNEYVMRLTHDIKGHIAAIESCLDVVLHHIGGKLSDKQEDLIGRAYRRSGKCMDFVKALLRLTRMKLTGRLDVEVFSLRNTIMDALAAVESRAANKSIEVTYDIADSVDEICAEPVLLGETLTNLLFNAVKYNVEGGKVSLRVSQSGDKIMFEVSDTGIGVPDGQEEKIFEEFYRAANARDIEREGTGLGLSIAKEVVERHGGTIWAANNTPEPGSTFGFSIPKNLTIDNK